MRNAAVLIAGATVLVLLTSFAPISWTKAPVTEQTLSSVSPWELMAGTKDLPTAERHDTH